jgi:hypothetical protein
MGIRKAIPRLLSAAALMLGFTPHSASIGEGATTGNI